MASGSAVAAALGLLMVLRYAPRLGLIQSPNPRSSHIRPTPTGGGIGIVAGAAVAGLLALGDDPTRIGAVLVASLGLGVLGLSDDIRPLAPGLRLPLQIALVGLGVAFAVPADALAAALGWPWGGPALLVVLTVGLVYWLNLFNFMDGIDGLAGSEAVFLLLAPPGLALIGGTAVATSPFFWWPLAVAVATLAFLAVNWPPAKLFMGDVGSTALGLLIGLFGTIEIAAGWLSSWEALILLACFLSDGTLTLLRRLLHGEPVLAAHRRHAYQRLARRFGAHLPVVLGVAAINLFWLLPLAIAAHLDPAVAPLLAILAYLPLIAVTLLAGAGRPEHA